MGGVGAALAQSRQSSTGTPSVIGETALVAFPTPLGLAPLYYSVARKFVDKAFRFDYKEGQQRPFWATLPRRAARQPTFSAVRNPAKH